VKQDPLVRAARAGSAPPGRKGFPTARGGEDAARSGAVAARNQGAFMVSDQAIGPMTVLDAPATTCSV